MSNIEHWHSDFGFRGLHTTFHHQCFQMVELTTMHCKCTMNRLNPHTLPHQPETSNNKLSSEVKEERAVQGEEWTTPNERVRVDNYAKTHDKNEEGNNENRHNEWHDDDLDNEKEDSQHCDARSDNNKVKNYRNQRNLQKKNMNKSILIC